MKISVAIITINAAVELERCLKSISFADEIIVLDQGSVDRTAEVCSHYGATLHQTQWLGFGRTKQKAAGLCRNRWVLSIDSDEELDSDLQQAINDLPENPDVAAYSVNRISQFLGRWIKHCGWHPEYVVRLFDTERAAFNDKAVHESIEVRGQIKQLPGLMKHFTYQTMEQYIEKLNKYTSLAAVEMFESGRRVSLLQAILRAHSTFWRMWILQGGIFDRLPGMVLCLSSSFYVLSKYTKLWRMGQR